MKNEVAEKGLNGLCVLHGEDYPQITDFNLSTNFSESILEKHAESDTHIYDPKGSKYMSRAFLYQIRGISELELLEEGETYRIEVAFKSGERRIIQDLNSTDIL